MNKVKLATVWLGGCSGCHMSFLDLDERLIELSELVELKASPLTDLKDFPEVDVTLVEGAVANTDHLHHLQLVRRRSKILIAFGDCAVTGNVTAMRNTIPSDELVQIIYGRANVVSGQPPDDDVVPRLTERVLPIHHVVKVDGYIPGCPPSPDLIYHAVKALISGDVPKLEKGRLRYG
jgi:NAD-reducing hydrogenase small subunit